MKRLLLLLSDSAHDIERVKASVPETREGCFEVCCDAEHSPVQAVTEHCERVLYFVQHTDSAANTERLLAAQKNFSGHQVLLGVHTQERLLPTWLDTAGFSACPPLAYSTAVFDDLARLALRLARKEPNNAESARLFDAAFDAFSKAWKRKPMQDLLSRARRTLHDILTPFATAQNFILTWQETGVSMDTLRGLTEPSKAAFANAFPNAERLIYRNRGSSDGGTLQELLGKIAAQVNVDDEFADLIEKELRRLVPATVSAQADDGYRLAREFLSGVADAQPRIPNEIREGGAGLRAFEKWLEQFFSLTDRLRELLARSSGEAKS